LGFQNYTYSVQYSSDEWNTDEKLREHKLSFW